MVTCSADCRSFQTQVQRPGLLAAVLIVALPAIMPAQAQVQQGGSQAPVTLPAAIDPAPVTEATDPAEAQAPASPPDNAAATDPALPGADAARVAEDVAPSEPAPSVFEDPAGAISHLLSQPQRRDDLPHDLSPWGMFLAADIVVKAVMLGLAFASLVTWTVWLAKSLEIGGARSRSRRVLKIIATSRNLTDAVGRLGGAGGPAALMLRAAQEEAALSDAAIDHAGGDGLKERVASALNRIEVAAGRQIGKGTGLLATIGSTAPFVGLFGTVWGIMNAFIGISEAQTTNLAVVAPGIAEALLATALGLVAAIPAVIIYNHFVRAIAAYRQLMGDVAAGVERLVSRDLDFRGIPVAPDQRVRVKAAE